MKPSNPQVLSNPRSAKLTPSMFGDPACKAFGLHNNQISGNSKINSAGWFSQNGARLGCGDLSLANMATIATNLYPGDIFIALTEADSFLDMPSSLDHGVPGEDYVYQKATWVIGQDPKNGAVILRIRDDITKPEERVEDGIRYFRYPRNEFFAGIGYTPKKMGSKPTSPVKKPILKTNEEKIREALAKLQALGGGKPKALHPQPAPPPNGPSGSLGAGSQGMGKKYAPAPTMPTSPSPAKKMVKKIKRISKP